MDIIPSLMNSTFEEYDNKLQKLGSVRKIYCNNLSVYLAPFVSYTYIFTYVQKICIAEK